MQRRVASPIHLQNTFRLPVNHSGAQPLISESYHMLAELQLMTRHAAELRVRPRLCEQLHYILFGAKVACIALSETSCAQHDVTTPRTSCSTDTHLCCNLPSVRAAPLRIQKHDPPAGSPKVHLSDYRRDPSVGPRRCV